MDAITLLILLIGFIQLPLLIDVLHATLPQTSRIPRMVSTTFKPFLILFVCILCGYTLVFYHTMFLPIKMRGQEMYVNKTNIEEAVASLSTPIPSSPILSIIYTFLAYWLWLNMFSHYVLAVLSAPSRTITSTITPPSTLMLSSPCSHCHTVHMQRTRYCRVCVRCVELMDHHCPFTGNCVGRENFQHFWLWLTWMLIGLGYALFMSWTPFHICVLRTLIYGKSVIGSTKLIPACAITGSASLTFLPTLFVECMLFILWCWETYLLYRDITTVEFLKRVMKISWNGGMRKTWSALMRPVDTSVTMDEENQMRTTTIHVTDAATRHVMTSIPPSARKTFAHLVLRGNHWTSLLIPPPIWWCLSLVGIHRCRSRTVTKEG